MLHINCPLSIISNLPTKLPIPNTYRDLDDENGSSDMYVEYQKILTYAYAYVLFFIYFENI